MNKVTTWVIVAIVVVVAGVAWLTRTTDEKVAPAAGHLALIPADTLFYMGSLEPVPAHDMFTSLSSVFRFADSQVWREVTRDSLADLEAEAGSPGARMLLGLMDFYLQHLGQPAQLLDQVGIADKVLASVYSVGMMPVLRFDADGARFDQFVQALEAEAGVQSSPQTLGEARYRTYALTQRKPGNIALLIGHHAGSAIFTLVIGSADPQYLKLALGLEAPEDSLQRSGALARLQQTYDYLPDALGYVSFEQIATALTSSDNRAGAMLAAFAAHEDEVSELRNPVCATELTGIARTWPRWVMGYRALDYSREGFSADYHMNLEINHAPLLETLQKLAGHIPAPLQAEQAGVMSLAIGLDINRVDEVLRELAGHAKALQLRCNALRGLNTLSEQIHAARPAVAMSTGMARGLKGFSASLLDVQLDDKSGKLSEVDALVSLSGEQIDALVNVLLALNPAAGMPELPADGSPVALPLPGSLAGKDGVPPEVYLAVKAPHALLYTGPASEAAHKALLDEPLNRDGLLYFAMDYGRYLAIASRFMDQAADDAQLEDEARARLDAFREAFSSLDYTETLQLRFSDKGLEATGRLVLDAP